MLPAQVCLLQGVACITGPLRLGVSPVGHGSSDRLAAPSVDFAYVPPPHEVHAMRTSPYLFAAILIGAAALTLTPATNADAAPARCAVTAAPATFLQAGSGFLSFAAPPVMPPSTLGGVGTSVIPPGPGPNGLCSVSGAAPGECSALQPGQRCSAHNNSGDACSALVLHG